MDKGTTLRAWRLSLPTNSSFMNPNLMPWRSLQNSMGLLPLNAVIPYQLLRECQSLPGSTKQRSMPPHPPCFQNPELNLGLSSEQHSWKGKITNTTLTAAGGIEPSLHSSTTAHHHGKCLLPPIQPSKHHSRHTSSNSNNNNDAHTTRTRFAKVTISVDLQGFCT